MPARKKTTRKKASTALARVNRSELALPTDMQDEFAALVNRDRASAVQAGWPWISTQGATMRLGTQEGDDVLAIILGANRANMYWDEPFEPGRFTPPACFAIASLDWDPAEVEEKLAPPKDLKSRQCDRCADCDWNAFGSANRGRGKACGNTVRLALIPADAKHLDKAEGAMLSVPPTSLKNWGKYAREVLDGLDRPVGTVVTRVRKVANREGAGFSFHFEMTDIIRERDKLEQLLVRMKGDARGALEQVPPSGSDSDAKGANGAGKSPQRRRRKVVRKSGRARRASAQA